MRISMHTSNHYYFCNRKNANSIHLFKQLNKRETNLGSPKLTKQTHFAANDGKSSHCVEFYFEDNQKTGFPIRSGMTEEISGMTRWMIFAGQRFYGSGIEIATIPTFSVGISQ